MALTSDGKLYGWGWNKVVIFCSLSSTFNNFFFPGYNYFCLDEHGPCNVIDR